MITRRRRDDDAQQLRRQHGLRAARSDPHRAGFLGPPFMRAATCWAQTVQPVRIQHCVAYRTCSRRMHPWHLSSGTSLVCLYMPRTAHIHTGVATRGSSHWDDHAGMGTPQVKPRPIIAALCPVPGSLSLGGNGWKLWPRADCWRGIGTSSHGTTDEQGSPKVATLLQRVDGIRWRVFGSVPDHAGAKGTKRLRRKLAGPAVVSWCVETCAIARARCP